MTSDAAAAALTFPKPQPSPAIEGAADYSQSPPPFPLSRALVSYYSRTAAIADHTGTTRLLPPQISLSQISPPLVRLHPPSPIDFACSGCEFLLLEMDTIVSAARECHRYIGSSKSRITSQFGSFSPSSSFRGMNCRAFNSDVAFMQSLPNKYFTIDGYSEAKSPSYSPQTSKKIKRSTPIPINRKPAPKEAAFTTDLFHSELYAGPADTKYAPKGSPCTTDLSRSKLWAGPAYTNSPPPSSLPIPKFSLRERRGVSLKLPL
ncbi:hypothetical protein ZIOFF_043583 [Zingiber officinale]|uniref:Uncharacterized protein n=1 Tax=Zingiber officinale TaxID=94328 RepID=A0A8J5FWV3_ZINOF|nr:hypothetical protein ZIOFF_043583 [Zingiber officinale]